MAGRCPAITSAFWNTQFQQVRPSTRTPSEAVLPTVRADHQRPTRPGQDGGGLGVEAGLAAPERGIQRAFADGEAEQLQQQAAQPQVADVVDEGQVHGRHDDVAAERRAPLHTTR
jgi:hypothetical protein